MAGTLFVVATPIGNLEDITVRALRVLREVAVIAAEDTRRTAGLLARHAIATPATSLHEHNEAGKLRSLVSRLVAGESVALVSDAGTPTVSDPGGLLIRAALDAGIRVEPVPGPSAVLTALAVSGFPTDFFAFFGFPPTKSNDRAAWAARLTAYRGTAVIFEAPHRLHATLHALVREVGDCEAVLCRELTKLHEEYVRGRLSKLGEDLVQCKGEYTIVLNIGEMPEHEPGPPIDTKALVAEFGVMTNQKGTTRRKAINQLSRKHGLAPNKVYELLESTKKSVE